MATKSGEIEGKLWCAYQALRRQHETAERSYYKYMAGDWSEAEAERMRKECEALRYQAEEAHSAWRTMGRTL